MPDVVQRIEELIAERQLAAGQRLPAERILAKHLGVSRSRLREAIQQLVSRGVIVSRQGGGTYVAEPARVAPLEQALKPLSPLMRRDTGYWQDVMEIRKSLDTEAAYYAALRATDQDRQRLMVSLEAALSTNGAEPEIQAQADAAFHVMIAEASQNLVLRQVVAGLSALLQESIAESLAQLHANPQNIATLDRQHRTIAEAIIGGRAEAARKATAEHLSFVENTLRCMEQDAARMRRSAADIDTISANGSNHP